MCVDPISASIGLAIGGKVVGAIGQANAASQNRREAARAALADKRAVVARTAEEVLALRQEETQAGRSLETIKSRILTQAAEGNVSGVSLDLLGYDIERQRGEISQGIAENIRILRQQTSRQLAGVEAQRESRTNAVQGPNLLQLGVGIATGVNQGLLIKEQRDFQNRTDENGTDENGTGE